MSGEILSEGRAGYVVLASCFGDDDTGGGLCTFDGFAVERIDRLSSTGLSLAGNRLLRLLRPASASVDGSIGGELLVYNDRGVERYYRIDLLSDPHDIVWDGQDFIVASSSTNSILWISPSGEVRQRWQAPGEGDAWHLNGLFIKDEQLFVCAFGKFQTHRGWVSGAGGSGFLFNFPTGQEVITGLWAPHTPRYIDGYWTICNSAKYELLQIDFFSPATIVRKLQLRGFTRGIAVSDDLLFVGESANRSDPSSGATASVAVVCRKTWSVLDRFPLPCSEIYELVLAPPSLMEGVRRGFRTNPLRVAEQDQYAMFRQVGVEPIRLWATGDPLPPEACKAKIEAILPSVLMANTLVELECIVENLGTALLVSAPPNSGGSTGLDRKSAFVKC